MVYTSCMCKDMRIPCAILAQNFLSHSFTGEGTSYELVGFNTSYNIHRSPVGDRTHRKKLMLKRTKIHIVVVEESSYRI